MARGHYLLPDDWEIIENATFAILRGAGQTLVPEILWWDISAGIVVGRLSIRLRFWTAAADARNDWLEDHVETMQFSAQPA